MEFKTFNTFINESMDELYHFTNVGNLMSIVRSDKMYGYECRDVKCQDDDKDIVDEYYAVSTTRMRYAKSGYPSTMINKNIVRITLDPSKIKQKYKLRHYVWDNAVRSPEDAKMFRRNRKIDPYGDWTSLFEAEERIIIRDRNGYIPDFHKYIKRIDICSTTFSSLDDIDTDLDFLMDYCHKYNIILKTYLTVKDFDFGR